MYLQQKSPSFLAGAVWPQHSLLRDVIFVLAGSWLIALTAQLSFTIGPVPITGQTFGVLLVGALLGSRRGAASVLAYLAQGFAGLPVFAGGAATTAVLAGPTAGYLLGFLPAALVVGWLCERGWDRRVETAVIAMLLGNLIIYAFGLPLLSRFVGWDQVLQLGLIPFIPGDILKVLLAAILMPSGWKLLQRFQ
ncbi:MAG: biotin transporter BioY [Chloroflexi bacterium]|nr:MAG: biotin transporter BioY [Chloroflexota bacterium]